MVTRVRIITLEMVLTLISLTESGKFFTIKALVGIKSIPKASMESIKSMHWSFHQDYLPLIPTVRWLSSISLVQIHNDLHLKYHIVPVLLNCHLLLLMIKWSSTSINKHSLWRVMIVPTKQNDISYIFSLLNWLLK